jgi:DNA-binding transcriptional LysR family regulator
MRKSDLIRHNVSHLVIFQSLLETGNVTATATQLHMSQPAVSRALAQLRDMFGDPLFVRAPGGVVPTDRARQLASRVTGLVDEMADLISPRDLDLNTTRRIFRIATTDYGAGTIIRDISQAFNEGAPRAGIEVVSLSSDVFRDLSEGRLDLVLYSDAAVPDSLLSDYLFEENYSCICRKDHPVIGKLTESTIPLDAFLDWPHALVTVFGGRYGLIDTALRELGRERHIALRLPFFSTAPLVIAQSDMLLTLPTRTAEHFAAIADLHCIRAPLEIPAFGYNQVWHRRTDQDPAMKWLRQLIKDRTH